MGEARKSLLYGAFREPVQNTPYKSDRLLQSAVPQCNMKWSVSPKPLLNLASAEPPAMIAFKMHCPPQKPALQRRTVADGSPIACELSRRELQIVRLVFEDAQERSIAGELSVSVNTIHTLLKRLYLKLGVRSRVGLVLRIVRENLADLQEAERPEPTVRLHRGARKAA